MDMLALYLIISIIKETIESDAPDDLKLSSIDDFLESLSMYMKANFG